MAHNAYITLTNSNGSLSKRFRVVHEGRKIVLTKAQNIDYTIGGKPDITVGAVQEIHNYLVRVRHTDPDSNYGTLDNLKTFYGYNNPNGTPSNLITMIDHYGTSKSVFMVGEFSENVMGINIEGSDAWFLVEVTFHVMPP